MALFDDIDAPLDGDDLTAEDAEVVSGLKPPQQNRLCLGFEKTESQLVKLFNADRFPHAIIFSGPTGIGKATFAFRLARFLLSQDSGGGMFAAEYVPVESFDVAEDGPSARRVDSGGHADLLVVGRVYDEAKKKLSNDIPVDEVRKITPFLRKTSAEGGWRVVVVDDAQHLNRSSQNAILKILEEPPKKTVLILITDQAGRFLPTIRSRCQIYDFKPLSDKNLAQLIQLGNYQGVNDDVIKNFAAGRIGRVKEISENGGDEIYADILNLLSKLPKFDTVEAFELSESLGRDAKRFPLFMDMLREYMATNIRRDARGQATDWPDSLNGLYTSQDWMDRYEVIETILSDTDRIHLDKKQAVLEVIWALEKE